MASTHAGRARTPREHVYHYGAHEKAAVTQLMGLYATREDAVDQLLRRKILVNLHRVVRQGLRAGVPSYSLKEVEALAAFARQADLRSGTRALLAYERWMATGDGALLESIAAYNDEDCQATLALRDWLVAHRLGGTPWRTRSAILLLDLVCTGLVLARACTPVGSVVGQWE